MISIKPALNLTERIVNIIAQSNRYKKKCNRFVENIPNNINSEQLTQLFGGSDKVVKVHFLPNKLETLGTKTAHVFLKSPEFAGSACASLHEFPPLCIKLMIINPHDIKENSEFEIFDLKDKKVWAFWSVIDLIKLFLLK